MPRITRIRPLLAATLGAALLTGCNEQEKPAEQPAGGTPTSPTTGQGQAPAATPTSGDREPDQVYTVRGEIRQLPDGENPAMGLQIRHESIPDFVNRDGDVVGMRPMIMQFTPAPDLDLSALVVGDKISFTFDVDWDGAPLMLVTEIEPLPADTELDFSAPAPSGG